MVLFDNDFVTLIHAVAKESAYLKTRATFIYK